MALGYTIVMFDVDDFKVVNDQYGHQGGDAVLKFITNQLRDHLRDEDFVFRYGGDEFMIIMQCPLPIVHHRMEEFRKVVESSIIQYNHHGIHITLSIGLHFVDEQNEHHRILDAVDKAMYMSKWAGKNQVSIYKSS